PAVPRQVEGVHIDPAGDAGVEVDEVEPAVRALGQFDGPPGRLPGAHVPGQGAAADLLGHSPGAVAVQVAQDALGAARRQPAGHRGAAAARRSADECNSAPDAPGEWWWVRISYAVTVGDRGSRTAGR